MSKTYQKNEIDTPNGLDLVVPEHVNVVMAEVAADMREGLLALAVGAGLQVMTALMDADVTALAGPKGKHVPDRVAVRHGTERGSVTLGGRRVPIERPRVRAADGSGELAVPAYELFTGTELLGRLAMEKMLAGLSTRRYAPAGLEPVGEQVTAAARSTSKSAVSRKFVAQTETALAELLSADLSSLDLVALMLDGVHFAETCCVVALGVDLQGSKHPARAGRGGDRERYRRHRPAGRAPRPRARCHPADPGRHRRVESAARRGARGVRRPGDPALPAPQDP